MNALAHMTHALLITYTLFPDVTPATKQERADVPWDVLVENIRKAPTYINKASCPLISIGEYGDARTDKDCLRHAANVRRVFGIEIDYDGEQMPVEEAASILQDAGICAVLYTSPSHTPQRPRWRALLPLSEPAIPEKRREYVGRANRVLGGIATRESFTLSQSFYLGRVRGAEYIVIDTQGRYVDMASDLEPLYYVGGSNDGESPRDATTDTDLRATFVNGHGRYEAMLKLSARWAARGMAADDIETSLLELLGAGSVNSNGIDLRTRAKPLADSAVMKFGETRAVYMPPPVTPVAPQPAAVIEEVPAVAEPVAIRQPIQWAQLETLEPPERDWIIDHWLSDGPTLIAGPGGVGKSLLAQTIGTAIALGQNYVDAVKPARVLVWACEDDHNEIWRRQIPISRYFNSTLSALSERLVIEPRRGCDNTLFATAFGAPTFTELMKELAAQVEDYKADVLILDNIAQTFGGNENDRHHVTKYINGLLGLTTRPLALLMMGHPAKSVASEFSGSTAWENAVRMRWYLGYTLPDETPKKPGEEEVVDPNIRYLAKRKSNYTTRDFRKLTYVDGVFKMDPVTAMTNGFSARYTFQAQCDAADSCVLYAIRKFVAQGIRTTDGKTSPDYLPKKMREAKLANDFAPRELAESLVRLRLTGQVKEAPMGINSNRTPKMGLVVTA